jgi:hypothetical protein
MGVGASRSRGMGQAAARVSRGCDAWCTELFDRGQPRHGARHQQRLLGPRHHRCPTSCAGFEQLRGAVHHASPSPGPTQDHRQPRHGRPPPTAAPRRAAFTAGRPCSPAPRPRSGRDHAPAAAGRGGRAGGQAMAGLSAAGPRGPRVPRGEECNRASRTAAARHVTPCPKHHAHERAHDSWCPRLS